MTDLEITRLCAEAMGYRYLCDGDNSGMIWVTFDGFKLSFHPLRNDAQCMALVKEFEITVSAGGEAWQVSIGREDCAGCYTTATDLNYAICVCVAKMQQERQK